MTAHTYACMNMSNRFNRCCAAGTSVCADIMMDTALRAVSIFLIVIILLVVRL